MTTRTNALTEYLTSFEGAQAPVQFTFAVLSLIFGAAYMCLFLLRPREMWRYPQSLAFWIYACDFLKSLSLAVVSGQLLLYEANVAKNDEQSRFIVTWHPDCLCGRDSSDAATTISDTHPGCACENGVFALMLQAGLIGSVAFYFAMAHNFYMSVKDPFTKPQSRLAPYHLVCWSLVAAFTAFYLPWDIYLPPGRTRDQAKKMTGFGYRAGYLACWFPERVTPDDEGFYKIISNLQIHITLTLPIGVAWLATPALYVLARKALRVGGPHGDEMRAPRAKQLKHGETLVGVFVSYMFVTGLIYFFSFAISYYGSAKGDWGGCEALDIGAVLAVISNYNHGELPTAFKPCWWVGVLQAAFSIMLASGGAVNALAGLYVHQELVLETLAPLTRRVGKLLRLHTRAATKVDGGDGGSGGGGRADAAESADSEVAAPPAATLVTPSGDISVSLRADIIAMTVRGIKQSIADVGVRPSSPSVLSGCRSRPRYPPEEAFSTAPLRASRSTDTDAADAPSSAVSPITHSADASGWPRELLAGHASVSSAVSYTSGHSWTAEGRPRSNSASLDLRNPLLGGPLASVPLPSASGSAGSGTPPFLPSPGVVRPSGGGMRLPLDEAFTQYKVIAFGENHLEGACDTLWHRLGGGDDRSAFTEYAPRVFAWMRKELYGVSSAEFVRSMEGYGDQTEEQVSKFSEAKGGGFFFFSADQTYRFKTVTKEEHTALLRMLPHYCRYLLSPRGRGSLIMRLCGCYAITMYGVTKYFFAQSNLFDPSSTPSPMHETYDLKGSWVDRHVGHSAGGAVRRSATRKDTDWPAARALRLSDSKKARLLRQAGDDARFLCSCRIMDYSLLLGIHIVTEERPACITAQANREPNSWAAESFEGPGVYVIGIIDIFQRWTLMKRAERYLKILFKLRCAADLREGMSALEPQAYARRFHSQFGTEQLQMSPEEVRRDWDDAVLAQAATIATQRRETSSWRGH